MQATTKRRQLMTEREKEDQEQLEYLREWKKKHSGRAKEESAIKRICKKGRKLWTERFLR